MDLKELRYILAIQQYGSITKAAEALYITQPALSKYLKNTEQQVGATLFSRINHVLVPTHIGRRYLDYAARICSIREDWEHESKDLLGESKGVISVAIPLMRGSCLLPDVLTRFYRRYPEVQVQLLEESHSVETVLLSSQAPDFAIYNDTQPHPQLMHQVLGKEEIVLVMNRDHPLVQSAVPQAGCRYSWIDPILLANQPLVMNAPEQTTGRIILEMLTAVGVEPKILLQTRNSDISLRMAAQGTALGFAPESYVRTARLGDNALCFSIGCPKCETTLYAVHQKGRYMSGYAQYFILLVQQVLSDMLC